MRSDAIVRRNRLHSSGASLRAPVALAMITEAGGVDRGEYDWPWVTIRS